MLTFANQLVEDMKIETKICLLKKKNFHMMAVPEEKSGNYQRIHLFIPPPYFIAVHPVVFQIFQSGSTL